MRSFIITLLATIFIDLPFLFQSTLPTHIASNLNTNNTKEYNWYYETREKGKPPLPPKETKDFALKYSSYYLGNKEKKEIFLTFDEGYENGYTAAILDILKKHNVKAAFFVVEPYIKGNPELIKRMVNEGHLVCNHSANHPSMAQVTKKEDFKRELQLVEEAFRTVTNKEMPKFFRPPMGNYSEHSLKVTEELGYKTIFWSFAYMDWVPENQPSKAFAFDKILSRTHNGAIILLHAVSKTNAEILDDIITKWKEEGYEIKSLDSLE